MENQSKINDQVTDTVNFVNNSNIGQSPPHSMGILDTVMAETIGMGMHNAITAQQNGQMIGNASVAATCSRILSVPMAKPPSTTTIGSSSGKPITPLQPTMATEISMANSEAKEGIATLQKLKKESEQNEKTIKDDLTNLDKIMKNPDDTPNSSSSSSSSDSSSSSSSSSS